MVEGNKQIRVDNWGTFFLQRLQVFFAKTDYCDLTLQFDGNVQLKVHRLVMNACTEYFRFLEETCSAMEENTIIMPPDLQSDVIVPIVNFMYTGMLEFHISLYAKLYKAAELMNINILTKLLDAQKITPTPNKPIKKPEKKQPPPISKPQFTADLPSPLPGKKTPVWKRKSAPGVSTPVQTYEKNWHTPDPLGMDNTPKPTRFEWPEDDLPTMTFMDTSFEDISYNSRPLLTKEDEEKVKPNFDDLRNNVEIPKQNTERTTGNEMNFKEIEEFAKQQKIRTAMFEDYDDSHEGSLKRKATLTQPSKSITKKIKISNKENKETTISVESNTPGDIDHTKIVTEILRKYPDLVKNNKNIKLKIMPGNKDSGGKKIVNAVVEQVKRQNVQPEPATKPKQIPKPVTVKRKNKIENDTVDDGPWVCKKCITAGGEVQEFVLYYLYRKHMTDVHDEAFDSRLCKYCGRKCNNHNLMLYHMYTKHALKPPPSYNFPKCDKCPYIAISTNRLEKHKLHHNPDEMQCQDCKLAFASAQNLTAHIRITGHFNKLGRVSYDCQYCMKKLQSSITLLSHIKRAHGSEGTRDGIVCLDELDSIEDPIEDEETEDEYIVPETLQKDKVKIISNVKVQPNRQISENTQLVPLETGAGAEALNNVSTNIATSLNLVDIVVLDENQQFILQQDGQNEQEFIIPELSHGQPFSGQVITTQDNTVIQQGMIQSSTGDIGSTDELVMVLTDHDYPDEQDGENPENSNIVVLYSHPVDGQEGQFITSQGNLMVNSQTGMLEIHNGSTIATTTANQMVVTNTVDSPIETIEMIQREITGRDLKQEPFFEDDQKPEVLMEKYPAKLQSMPNIQDISESETQEVPTENEQENTTPIEKEQHVEEPQTEENLEQPQDQIEENLEQPQEDKDTSQDIVDGSLDVSAEEPMDIEETDHKTAENEMEESMEDEQPKNVSESPKDAEKDEGVDVPPYSVILKDPALIGITEPNQELPSITEETKKQVEDKEEPMEVDGKIEEGKGNVNEKDTENEEVVEKECVAAEEEQVDMENSKEVQQLDTENSNKEQQVDIENSNEEQQVDTENSNEEQQRVDTEHGNEEQQVDTENSNEEQQMEANDAEEGEIRDVDETDNPASQDELEEVQQEEQEPSKDDEEHSSEKSLPESIPVKNTTDINRTIILDDWEDDTDSQQSEKNADSESQIEKESAVPSAVENVNKLMDDWDEEEEDERKD